MGQLLKQQKISKIDANANEKLLMMTKMAMVLPLVKINDAMVMAMAMVIISFFFLLMNLCNYSWQYLC